MSDKRSVLFVCTANRFRSPLAEAVFRKLLREHGIDMNWDVGSAGSWTEGGLPPIPSAAWFRDQLGLDLSQHRSRSVSRELMTKYHLILVMEKGHKEALRVEFPEMSRKVWMLTELCDSPGYDIPDPATQPEETYLGVAREITALIEKCFPEICRLAGA